MTKNRFVLIDAFALIFRAYYGIPATLSVGEQPIHAVYGFTSALLSAIRTLDPEYLAVGMDKGKSHRVKDFENYKIHRKPTPDDLISQVPYVQEILSAMDIPTFAVEGYEGEDIIATMVAQVKSRKLKVESGEEIEFIIVTGDMDLLQLIDAQTKVYSMARGVNQAVLYDEKKVEERYGLNASQFVDFKALKGDASDNIPGVPGIGEKSACKLITEYENLENIYENIENISGKTQTLLKDNKAQAFLSKKLSKIRDDVPLDFSLSSAKINHYNKDKTTQLFSRLGFRSLISRLPHEIKPVATKTEKQQQLF